MWASEIQGIQGIRAVGVEWRLPVASLASVRRCSSGSGSLSLCAAHGASWRCHAFFQTIWKATPHGQRKQQTGRTPVHLPPLLGGRWTGRCRTRPLGSCLARNGEWNGETWRSLGKVLVAWGHALAPLGHVTPQRGLRRLQARYGAARIRDLLTDALTACVRLGRLRMLLTSRRVTRRWSLI